MNEGILQGAGGVDLAFRSWQAEGAPRGVVVIVHGFKAHGGMYEWTAERLTARGYSVYVADLRGHGKSAGERYHVDAFDDYIGDLTAFLTLVRNSEGEAAPLFLLGHSAGGVIAALYAQGARHSIAGLISEDFAHELPPPTVALALLKGISHLAPHVHLLNLKDEDFSRDAEFVAKMKADPLALHMPGTAQLLGELIRADERLRKAFAEITLPVLIMHGTADRIAKPQGSQHFYDKVGATDKTVKFYEGHYHDLLNDLGKEGVLADIVEWMDIRARRPAT